MQVNINMSKGSALLRIQSLYDSFNSAEKRIADVILADPKSMAEMSINRIADSSNTSYATVTRFCHRLEYSGFKELKAEMIHSLVNNRGVDDIIKSLDINQNASTKQICENIYTLAFKVLDESLSLMDISTIDSVVEKLTSAEKICFIGAGISGICARYAYSKFLSIGLPCYYEADNTINKMALSLLGEKDVLFAISSSGRTSAIVDAVHIAKKNGVTIISLSDFALSPLAKASDYNIYTTPRNGSTFLNIDMPLLMGQVTILDMLYTCCCIKSGETAAKNYKTTRESVDREKIK
jgi:DNA-binding MurR/RpiR family transcriptional regulator